MPNLDLKYEIEEQEGCEDIYFIDTTGIYDPLTNPGGYGIGTFDTIAALLVEIVVTPIGYTVGYKFTFVLFSGTILSATVLTPAGVSINIFADLVTTAWPFISGVNPFVITSSYLGFSTGEITSGGYNISYYIEGSPEGENYKTDEDHLLVCQICCCVEQAAANLKACDCENNGEALNNAINSQIYLDAAVWATEGGDIDKGIANLALAKKYCEGKCKNC